MPTTTARLAHSRAFLAFDGTGETIPQGNRAHPRSGRASPLPRRWSIRWAPPLPHGTRTPPLVLTLRLEARPPIPPPVRPRQRHRRLLRSVPPARHRSVLMPTPGLLGACSRAQAGSRSSAERRSTRGPPCARCARCLRGPCPSQTRARPSACARMGGAFTLRRQWRLRVMRAPRGALLDVLRTRQAAVFKRVVAEVFSMFGM
jgi:hypothetical protein